MTDALDALWRELCDALRAAAQSAKLTYRDVKGAPEIVAPSGSILTLYRTQPHIATCKMAFQPNPDDDRPNIFTVRLQEQPRGFRRRHGAMEFDLESAADVARNYVLTFTEADKK